MTTWHGLCNRAFLRSCCFKRGFYDMQHTRKAALTLAAALAAGFFAAQTAQAQVIPYSGADLGAQPGSILTNSNAAA